jgi:nucleoid-associated protein EbfC
MTDNPFESLGGGGFDLQGLLQQAQQMQEQLESAQEQLADSRVEGSAGGGVVTVTVNGVGELQDVTISPGALARFPEVGEDDLADVGDLVVAAYRDAKAKADSLASSALGPLGGGLGGGPGGGLPGGGPGDAGPGALGFSPGAE